MLVIDDIRVSYGGTEAVRGVSLRVAPGEVFGLLGPNGAGKSSTIAACTGLVPTVSGTISIADAGPPGKAAAREMIGLCPQDLALFDRLTARENLRLFAQLQGMTGSKAASRADELLEVVGLTPHAARRVKTFSGGMKRRLNLAAAIVHDPPVVLLDEPTAGVDPQSRNAIFGLIEELRSRGRAVVYSTHYMEEAQRLCDRVGIIDQGALLEVGTVEDLIGRYGGDAVVTIERASGDDRRPTDAPIAVLQSVDFEAEGDDRVLGVRVDRPDLERVFLNLTGRSLRDE